MNVSILQIIMVPLYLVHLVKHLHPWMATHAVNAGKLQWCLQHLLNIIECQVMVEQLLAAETA